MEDNQSKTRSLSVKAFFESQKSNIRFNLKEDRDFSLFLLVGFLSGIAGGINATIFNNYLNDAYHLTADLRGLVELPRELPGLLIVIVLGLLSFLGDIRMAAVGMLAASLGMLGLGLFSPGFTVMLAWMMVFSLGTHIFMPLSASIGMSLSKPESYGSRLGRFSAYSLTATIIGYGIVWTGFKFFNMTYAIAFVIASVFYVMAAFVLKIMHRKQTKISRVRFVFRKRYTLFYCMSVVNGARKQIFLTFAPWVLIQVFHLDAPTFAVLGIIIATVSIVSRKIVGDAIDRLGERTVLSLEAVLLVVICMGYAFAADLVPLSAAVVIIAVCYILDNSMSAVEMARSTYVRKIALDPTDVMPTLSAGVSFDHIVAMTIPILGGLLWKTMGYQYVFMAAALIGVLNLILSLKIRIPGKTGGTIEQQVVLDEIT
ncbi:MAG: MFS transporter [Eubacteriales bacterium]